LPVGCHIYVACNASCHRFKFWDTGNNCFFSITVFDHLPSVLWHCWLGTRKSIHPVKTVWWGAGAIVCKWFAYDLADATAKPLSVAWLKSTMVYFSGAGLPGCHGKEAIILVLFNHLINFVHCFVILYVAEINKMHEAITFSTTVE